MLFVLVFSQGVCVPKFLFQVDLPIIRNGVGAHLHPMNNKIKNTKTFLKYLYFLGVQDAQLCDVRANL